MKPRHRDDAGAGCEDSSKSGLSVLRLDDDPVDVFHLVRALYDGLYVISLLFFFMFSFFQVFPSSHACVFLFFIALLILYVTDDVATVFFFSLFRFISFLPMQLSFLHMKRKERKKKITSSIPFLGAHQHR